MKTNNHNEEKSFPWEWPVIAPGPSWNIPRISLPGCLGPLLQYENEWWYYAGFAKDSAGNHYSLQFSINRIPVANADPLFQVIACLTGIGDHATNTYFFDTAYGMGISTNESIPLGLTIPTVTDTAYDIATSPVIGTGKTRVQLTEGNAGVLWSRYTLTSSSSATGGTYAAELNLVDERGMIMEWQSAYIGPGDDSTFGSPSFEFAQPRLRIESGTLTLNGSPRTITGGMLWLDRQVLTNPPSNTSRQHITGDGLNSSELITSVINNPAKLKPLYLGSWMGITLQNGVSMVLSCFWQPAAQGKLQWKTGTLLGLPPLMANGNIYFTLDEDLRRVPNGGSYLRGHELNDPNPEVFDFDVNILNPNKPDDSPHWKSPLSGSTYSNGWWIRIDPKWQQYGLPENLYIRAMVSGCENALPSPQLPLNTFWEGAATVYADSELKQVIGHAFVEQMGFN